MIHPARKQTGTTIQPKAASSIVVPANKLAKLGGTQNDLNRQVARHDIFQHLYSEVGRVHEELGFGISTHQRMLASTMLMHMYEIACVDSDKRIEAPTCTFARLKEPGKPPLATLHFADAGDRDGDGMLEHFKKEQGYKTLMAGFENGRFHLGHKPNRDELIRMLFRNGKLYSFFKIEDNWETLVQGTVEEACHFADDVSLRSDNISFKLDKHTSRAFPNYVFEDGLSKHKGNTWDLSWSPEVLIP